MATTADYNLGPFTFPRGWFMVARSADLGNQPMPLRMFGRELALYRVESGQPYLLDAVPLYQLDAGRFELGTHRGIHPGVAARDPMPTSPCQLGNTAHERAADTQDVNVHEINPR